MTTVHAVRAIMVDGSSVDLLLFFDAPDAEQHANVIRDHCRLLGFDHIEVVERRIIGKGEPTDRRRHKADHAQDRRRFTRDEIRDVG